jgi:hypothetical protein
LSAKPKQSADLLLIQHDGQNPFSGAYANAIYVRRRANGKFTVWVKAWNSDGAAEDCWQKDLASAAEFVSACEACLEFVEFGEADVVDVIRSGFEGLRKLDLSFADTLRTALLEQFSEDCAAPPAEPTDFSDAKVAIKRLNKEEAQQKYGASMIFHSGPREPSKAPVSQPPSSPTPDMPPSADPPLVRDYINYCVVRSTYKWNDLRMLLDKVAAINDAQQGNALRDALAHLIAGGPYRNNPVRQFVDYFKNNMGEPCLAVLRENVRNPAIDRRLRAQCYQCLVDLKVQGYTREEFRSLAQKNAAIASASELAIREAFVQAAKEGYTYAKLKGAGHEARCHLRSFVRSCIEGANIPSDTVRKGYSYGRVYSTELVKMVANALGVEWHMLARW